MSPESKDQVWSEQMRAAIAGDELAYRDVLTGLTPVIRSAARSGLNRFGAEPNDIEDVVQETLLAIHLKRHTWRQSEPLKPWVLAIARNKLIDILRRRGHRVNVPIEDYADVLPAPVMEPGLDGEEVSAMLDVLPPRQRDLVRLITLEGLPVREVAGRLAMKEGAVRVALHRSLKAMAVFYRSRLS